MKEANHAVPESTPSSSPSATVPEEFGANEWLVEEMYDRFQADPSSVDQTWVDYFKAHDNGAPQGGSGSNGGTTRSTNGTPAATASAATPTATPTASTTESKPAPMAATPTPAPVATA